MAAKTNVNFTKFFQKRQKLRLIEKIGSRYELMTGNYLDREKTKYDILKIIYQILYDILVLRYR